MIKIRGIKTIDGEITNKMLESPYHEEIDASGLTLFPGLIDPHVHFRTPGHTYKEDWESAAFASISGGFTTVFDMPNNNPACITKKRLQEKKEIVNAMLKNAGIPLHYFLYLGADKHHFDEIPLIKNTAIGIKLFMGSSEGDLVMDDENSMDELFRLCAELNLLVSVHAEDEKLINTRKTLCSLKDIRAHSFIRNVEVAVRATKKAIKLCHRYKTRLNILHVSTKEEVDLIKKAKDDGLPVTAETTPHYLFLNQDHYKELSVRGKVNPSLKSAEDNKSLLKALNDGTIDMIGSDHAPHTLEEKDRPYPHGPSGFPGIETTLPLLLTAYHEGKISLKRIIEVTCLRIREIFHLPVTDDFVLVDLQKEKTVMEEDLKTKCGWSPYAGKKLKGWPIYTCLKGKIYHVAHEATSAL